MYHYINRRYSLLSSQLAPTINSEALSIQYVVITHNSVTVFFVLRLKYFFHIGRDWESNPQQGALQHSKSSGALPNWTTRAELRKYD